MQNGPGMLNARTVAMQHITSRAPGPHGVHTMGPRMQPPGMMQLGGPVNQGMPPNNASYAAYPNPNGATQNVQVGMYNFGISKILY